MARLAHTLPRSHPLAAVIELAVLPLAASVEDWSIDQEPMGPGWHDSSWMLKKGLDVIEGLPPEGVPPEWQWRWWRAAGAGLALQSTSDAKSASRERSPRASVTWPPCGQPLKRSTA